MGELEGAVDAVRGSAFHENNRSAIRGVLIALADQLPAVTVGLVDELLDANEQGVAVGMLSDMLVESGATIAPDDIAAIANVVEAMRLDTVVVDQLRPLVADVQS